MAKKTRKIKRLLNLIILLRTGEGIKINDLAKRCGVSERTIYRDLSDLTASDIPICYDRGYRLKINENLPPFCFSSREKAFLLKKLKSSMILNGDEIAIAKKIIEKLEASVNSCRNQ
jgi:predicted DNA-binding transcriptional regulator YafY